MFMSECTISILGLGQIMTSIALMLRNLAAFHLGMNLFFDKCFIILIYLLCCHLWGEQLLCLDILAREQ